MSAHYFSDDALDLVQRLLPEKPTPQPRHAGKTRTLPNDVYHMSYQEIAAEFGCTFQNIQQVEKRALGKLRRIIAARGLEAGLREILKP